MSMVEQAAGMVQDGTVIGLGSGHTASTFLHALGRRVREGLNVRGVPTSEATAALAQQIGVPLATLDEVEELDATFDGADAVDPHLDLIKGLGGALLREKVVAASSKRLVILVDERKLTDRLGRGYCRVLPLEVIPFAIPLIQRRVHGIGLNSQVRVQKGEPVRTDSGNLLLDCDISATVPDPRALDRSLRSIPGVVETGLFLGMASLVLVERADGTVLEKPRPHHESTSP